MKWLLLCLVLSCANISITEKKYVRKDWNHWIDEDNNCMNTRAEILGTRSLVPVTLNRKGCTVKTGKWEDYYHPEIHTLAKSVDIDHLVPLKNAHISGGAHWSSRSKQEFANDPQNLVITNKSYNRKKGAKGPDEWLPVKIEYACKYIKDWVKIKYIYDLQVLPAEQKAIDLLKPKCEALIQAGRS